MPAPPVAAGGVQLGGRLPTHRKNRVHTELADIALVQVHFRTELRCLCGWEYHVNDVNAQKCKHTAVVHPSSLSTWRSCNPCSQQGLDSEPM